MAGPISGLPTVALFGAKGKVVVNAADAAEWKAKGYYETEGQYRRATAKTVAAPVNGRGGKPTEKPPGDKPAANPTIADPIGDDGDDDKSGDAPN